LHLPTFSTNLVSNAAIQDVWVDTFIPRGQRVAICTSGGCVESGVCVWSACSVLLVSGTLPPDSSLAPPPRSPLPAASPQHALPSPCLWPFQVPALPPTLACPTVPSMRRGAAVRRSSFLRVSSDHCSSEFPPLPAPVGGTDQELYFLLVVDDYTRYTTVFSLRCKADVSGVLIPWIRATHPQLCERFSRDFPALCLHSDRGEVARTSMIHAATPHFLWPFAVRYAAHQLNLWPHVSKPETSPTLRWTGKVGNASVFRVWGALSLVCDAKASKLSSRTLRCIFLGFPTDAPP
ncbi:unnamed protein product, partial [Closterium sp. NIES-54]